MNLRSHVILWYFSFIEKAATNNSGRGEVNMEIECEGVNTRGKSGNKNPLAFLGLKRVDVEEEDEDEDTKSDDNDIDTHSKNN